MTRIRGCNNFKVVLELYAKFIHLYREEIFIVNIRATYKLNEIKNDYRNIAFGAENSNLWLFWPPKLFKLFEVVRDCLTGFKIIFRQITNISSLNVWLDFFLGILL